VSGLQEREVHRVEEVLCGAAGISAVGRLVCKMYNIRVRSFEGVASPR
jgi:hypothetical protein